jgi:hypothetical protein
MYKEHRALTAARAPAAVGALERGPHHVGVAGAVEGVVRAPLGHPDNVLHIYT